MTEHERYADYINSLQEVFSPQLEALYGRARQEHIPVIRRETGALIRFLIKEKQPKQILEVGTAIGFSALFMQSCFPDCRIDTIERDKERAAAARENFARFPGGEKITLYEGDAARVLEELPEDTYDLVFMDAAKGQYIAFLPEVKRVLRDGGLLISDNVLRGGDIIASRYAVTRRNRTIHSRMREFLQAITKDEDFVTGVLTVGDGVALSHYEKGEKTC